MLRSPIRDVRDSLTSGSGIDIVNNPIDFLDGFENKELLKKPRIITGHDGKKYAVQPLYATYLSGNKDGTGTRYNFGNGYKNKNLDGSSNYQYNAGLGYDRQASHVGRGYAQWGNKYNRESSTNYGSEIPANNLLDNRLLKGGDPLPIVF